MNFWIEKTLVNGFDHKTVGDRGMGKVLWSPRTGSDGRDTYKNMKLVMPGDLVIHFIDNSKISGISEVENGAIETEGLEGTPWDKPSYLIKLKNYKELKPHVDRYSLLNDENKSILNRISENSEVFYNKNMNLRQGGYLSPCPIELLTLVNEIYKAKSSQNLPFLDEKGIVLSTPINKSYWVFQGNPDRYDFEKAIGDELLETFRISSHKNNIKTGDKVIIWLSGKNLGCYGLAEVSSDPYERPPHKNDELWKDENLNDLIVDIKLTHNLYDSPILKEEIDDFPELENLNVGHQGSNFRATKEEYDKLLSFVEDGGYSFEEELSKYDEADLKAFFTFLFQILDKFEIKKGDNRLHYSTKRNRISFVIGQRYSWALFKSNKKGKYWVLSIKSIRPASIKFDGNLPHPFHTFIQEPDFSSSELDSIYDGFAQELTRTAKSGFRKHTDLAFEEAVFDSKFRNRFNKTQSSYTDDMVLNKILFGPPGTGKTYNTINEALSIVEPSFYKENKGNRDSLNKRFKELLIKNWDNTNGQIAFCTFHQSFSYEDFVEGIKPKTNDKKEVYYEIEDGIFKKICQLANSSVSAVKMNNEGKLSWDETQFEQASFYKLSLGESNSPNDSLIYEYCRDNNVISVGYGDETNFTGMTEDEISRKCEELDLSVGTAQRLNYFIHDLKNEDYVIVSNGNRYIRCLGKVIGDYEYVEDSPIDYHHFRKVEWIFKDENIPVEEVYDTNFNQKTIYKLDTNRLKKGFFVNQNQVAKSEIKKVKDYILIIDEINRGNVSSIFGELITLIEPDKRAGQNEELEVTLPYSKEPFKVPHNVYIVGTMNTADRSIEALDTALRRRFSFVEKPPVPELIRNEGKSGKVNGIVNGINLQKVLETINKRIEKLIDKDHKIGHSYFLKVNDKESLMNCFENEVIPLLEEYFFGDYGKIGLVLGDSFVAKDQTEDFEFAEFGGYDADVSSDLKERSVYKIRPSKDWDFNSI
jgi:hypothetical protein